MLSKLGSGLLLVFVMSCVTLVSPASAAIKCGDVITGDTRLKKDLDCRKSDSDFGLTVGADDINLDLGGNAIIGKSRQAGVRVQGRSGVKVTNGSLRTFGVGIQAGGGNQTTLSKLTIRGSDAHGVHVQDAAQTTISKNTIQDSERNVTVTGITSQTLIENNRIAAGEVGVDVMQGSNATVQDNFIAASTDAAITVGGSSGIPVTSTVVEGNALERSEGVGIRIHSNPLSVSIAQNEILESDDAGIEVFSGRGVDINANVLLGNGDGIFISNLESNFSYPDFLRDNVVKRSTFDGILVHDSEIAIERNQAIANGRYGISSASSNGGDNVARRNGEAPQCQPASLCE